MRNTTHVRHFLVLRLVIALSGFVLIVLWDASQGQAASPQGSAILYAVVAAYSLEAILARVAMRLVTRVRLFITLQVAVDLSMEGLLVACTGGAASVFCPLFIASIFAASTVLSVEGAMVCSSSATIILALACMLPQMASGATGGDYSWRLASYLFTYGLAFHGVSLLSSRVVGGAAEAECLTEEIIENMAEGLIAADTQGRILAVNEKARALLGCEQGRRLEGARIDALAGRRERAFVAERLRAGGEGHWEHVFEVDPGRRIPVLVTTTVLRDDKGRKRGTVLLLQDLSLRREVEAATRRIARLEELTEVARGIAHEVRNPLASMCGCAEEIAHETNLSPETVRLTEILRREARRIDGIIDEFLNFARIRKLKVCVVDVGELIGHVGELLRARAGRSEVRVERPCGRTEVWGDRDLLTQLFLNLGINALEAMGAATGMVRVRAEIVGGPGGRSPAVEVTVEDNGCGIAREDLGKLFTPFFSRKARGTGLGLAIANRIAQVHGGAIGVESAPGRGSTFRVRLPQGSNAQDVREPEPEEAVWM